MNPENPKQDRNAGYSSAFGAGSHVLARRWLSNLCRRPSEDLGAERTDCRSSKGAGAVAVLGSGFTGQENGIDGA